MKLKSCLCHFRAVMMHPLKQIMQNRATRRSLEAMSSLFQPLTPTQGTGKTHLRIEAQHGLWYGAIIGVLIGLYVLFFPRWITVSPVWYTHASWYEILAITTFSSMLVAGCGAAVLGAHILKRRSRTSHQTQSKISTTLAKNNSG